MLADFNVSLQKFEKNLFQPGRSLFLSLPSLSFSLSLPCSVPSRGSGHRPPGEQCLPAPGAKPMASVASSTSYAMPLSHASPLRAVRSPSARTPRATRCRPPCPDKPVSELAIRQTGSNSRLQPQVVTARSPSPTQIPHLPSWHVPRGSRFPTIARRRAEAPSTCRQPARATPKPCSVPNPPWPFPLLLLCLQKQCQASPVLPPPPVLTKAVPGLPCLAHELHTVATIVACTTLMLNFCFWPPSTSINPKIGSPRPIEAP
jgi:hypothetical protein